MWCLSLNLSVVCPLTGDASPSYLWKLYTWRRLPYNKNLTRPRVQTFDLIKQVMPNVKFIIMLRDPVERYVFIDTLACRQLYRNIKKKNIQWTRNKNQPVKDVNWDDWEHGSNTTLEITDLWHLQLTLNHWSRHMTSESKVMAWDRYTIMVGLNQLMASEPSSFWQLDLQQQYRYTVYFNNIP